MTSTLTYIRKGWHIRRGPRVALLLGSLLLHGYASGDAIPLITCGPQGFPSIVPIPAWGA